MFSVSVIIPTYNRLAVLSRAVDSVLAQNRLADEVIIVDDGSNDGTIAWLEKTYAGLEVIRQKNKGVSAARNAGIKRAKGDWICLLDSDDSWHESKLEKQAEALARHSEYLIAHTDEVWYRNGVILNQRKKHKKHGGHIFQHCLPLCVISPSAVMIHRKLFDDVGLFDESLPTCEDYDMWLRACRKYPVLFLPTALTNKYGGHEDQLSRKYWGMDRFRIIALERIIESGHLCEEDRSAAVSMLLKKVDIFLKGVKKHGESQYSHIFKRLSEKYI